MKIVSLNKELASITAFAGALDIATRCDNYDSSYIYFRHKSWFQYWGHDCMYIIGNKATIYKYHKNCLEIIAQYENLFGVLLEVNIKE